MEQRNTPEFTLEAFADPSTVRDVVRGLLHTIFFHRFFPSILPQTRDVLDLTLPYVSDSELITMIDQHSTSLVRQLDAERNQPHPQRPSHTGGSGRGQLTVKFFEKKRRKLAWYHQFSDDSDQVCWESWTVKVTVAEPRTESERAKVRRAAESTLQNAVMKVVTLANAHKDHIPPITTTETNPFPYQIRVSSGAQGVQQQTGGVGGWAARMGIY